MKIAVIGTGNIGGTLGTKWRAAGHEGALAGRVVVDATNQMGADRTDHQEAITAGVSGVKYARAFNIYGWENFADPHPGTTLFFAADPAARAVTEELISAVGLEPAYVGDTSATVTVNGLAALWFSLVQQHGGQRRLALRLLS
jgi:8-hydroxy-5-deazaflavin:NADPH oxidoreductase